MRRLVLFDIDETMVSSDGCGRRALERAMSEIVGRPIDSDGHSLSGKTDPQICREILTSRGVSDEEVSIMLPRLFEIYVPLLEDEVRLAKEFRVHLGVRELLDKLAARKDAFLGLLTGNIEPGAKVKLRPHDLNRYFSLGAFGSDSHDRMHLPEVAHKRANGAFNQQFEIDEIVIIGDARNDVLCAKGYGAKSIITCTGKTPRETLAALQPDHLFDNLGNTEQVIEAIFA